MTEEPYMTIEFTDEDGNVIPEVTAEFNKEDWEAIEQQAKEAKMTIQEWFTTALENYVDKNPIDEKACACGDECKNC